MVTSLPYPFREEFVDCGDGHLLYVAAYGNLKGVPVFVLHGGPGYGSEPEMLAPFDLSDWQVILCDQRGAGKSKPSGSLQENTLWHLVADINRIADYLQLDTFVLKGGSWGTTLALAYAEHNPQRVRSMILRGVFLGEENEALITRLDGVQRHFPEAWHAFVSALPPTLVNQPFAAYTHYILHGSSEESLKYAREAIVLEFLAAGLCSTRNEAILLCNSFDFLATARIEYHYLSNNYFLYPGQILGQSRSIYNIPTSIIHGRYDMVCPPESAWHLAQHLADCHLQIVENAGHTEDNPTIQSVLRTTVQRHHPIPAS